MSNTPLVETYSRLARTVTCMLQLARAGDWSGLPELDVQCTTIVDALRDMEPTHALEPLERARVMALMTRIRCDQDELTALIRPQLNDLMRKMHELQRRRGVTRAYHLQS